jgi:chromate transporter
MQMRDAMTGWREAMAGGERCDAITRRALFLTFAEIGLSGFGGVLPFARRILVEQRGWLTPAEFAEALGLGQALPGPNVVNMSIAIGNRFHGPFGAALAFSGLMLPTLGAFLALGALHERFADVAVVERVLHTVAAAAAGLVVATGVKLARALPRSWAAAGIVALTCAGAGIWKLPLPPLLLVAAPIGVAASWWRNR